MKLSEFAAMQLGSEIVEEFEDWENKSQEPHDYDNDNTSELDDEDRFITNEEDLEFREKWSWYNKTVPKHVLDMLAQIKTDAFFNIPGVDLVLRDFCARNIYEFYCQPIDIKQWLGALAKQYVKLIENAPDTAKFLLLDISREGFHEGDENHHVWPLIRGITYPLEQLFGYPEKCLDDIYLDFLIKEIVPED